MLYVKGTRKVAVIVFVSMVSVATLSSLSPSSSSVSKQPVTLLTFDVDGTLVKSVKSNKQGHEQTIHAKAFMYAIGKSFTADDSFSNEHSSPLDFIPPKRYHGSTDGLILLNTIQYAFNIQSSAALSKLNDMYRHMYEYFRDISDVDVANNIQPLPGVIETLKSLSSYRKSAIMCGLVTGNVEGIARKKMRAVGIYDTGVFHRKAADQVWDGEDEHSFLGGFGSDYCSGDIVDESRQFKDRGEQILITYRRALSLLDENQDIVRVVHIGDAPNDVLAAKWCFEEGKFGPCVTVGCIGVATGSYSADTLKAFAGEPIKGLYEPVVLEDGIADPSFISSCGL